MKSPKSKIDLETYDRRGLYDIFKNLEVPVISTTCNIDITKLKECTEAFGINFFVGMSYFVSLTMNEIPQLRHRIIDDVLYEFEYVNPGYTVLLSNETFSFCDSEHSTSFQNFYQKSQSIISKVKKNPDTGMGPKDDMFFISNIPWFSFTSFTHPYNSEYASIPIVTYGKYFKTNNSLFMPVAIQVNHALVDGIHIGKFYKRIEELTKNANVHLNA